MDHVIIDGYNVLHAIPALKKTLLQDAHTAREMFIHAVSRMSHTRKFRCTIVFDGAEPSGTAKQTSHAPVHVVYSFPETADARIRRMIEQSKQRTQLVIVSSDRGITDLARVCSCQVHTAQHFANLLSSEDDVVTEKSDVTLSPQQVKEWLRIFGEE